jgi:hypothetical protein
MADVLARKFQMSEAAAVSNCVARTGGGAGGFNDGAPGMPQYSDGSDVNSIYEDSGTSSRAE